MVLLSALGRAASGVFSCARARSLAESSSSGCLVPLGLTPSGTGALSGCGRATCSRVAGEAELFWPMLPPITSSTGRARICVSVSAGRWPQIPERQQQQQAVQQQRQQDARSTVLPQPFGPGLHGLTLLI